MAEGKLRVLLVDDEPAIVKILGRLLELAGFEVSTAMDGEEGLAKVRAWHPEAVVLDLMLPKMNGMEVCAALKGDAQYRHIPVVIFTARRQEMDEKLCRECGADAYITKAQQSRALLEQLEALLGRIVTRRAPQPGV